MAVTTDWCIARASARIVTGMRPVAAGGLADRRRQRVRAVVDELAAVDPEAALGGDRDLDRSPARRPRRAAMPASGSRTCSRPSSMNLVDSMKKISSSSTTSISDIMLSSGSSVPAAGISRRASWSPRAVSAASIGGRGRALRARSMACTSLMRFLLHLDDEARPRGRAGSGRRPAPGSRPAGPAAVVISASEMPPAMAAGSPTPPA